MLALELITKLLGELQCSLNSFHFTQSMKSISILSFILLSAFGAFTQASQTDTIHFDHLGFVGAPRFFFGDSLWFVLDGEGNKVMKCDQEGRLLSSFEIFQNSTEIGCRAPGDLFVYSNKIFIHQFNSTILTFDWNGKFLRRIEFNPKWEKNYYQIDDDRLTDYVFQANTTGKLIFFVRKIPSIPIDSYQEAHKQIYDDKVLATFQLNAKQKKLKNAGFFGEFPQIYEDSLALSYNAGSFACSASDSSIFLSFASDYKIVELNFHGDTLRKFGMRGQNIPIDSRLPRIKSLEEHNSIAAYCRALAFRYSEFAFDKSQNILYRTYLPPALTNQVDQLNPVWDDAKFDQLTKAKPMYLQIYDLKTMPISVKEVPLTGRVQLLHAKNGSLWCLDKSNAEKYQIIRFENLSGE